MAKHCCDSLFSVRAPAPGWRFRGGAALLLFVMLAGCGVTGSPQAPKGVDLSGHWKLNESASDSTERLIATLEQQDFRFSKRGAGQGSINTTVPPSDGMRSNRPGPHDEYLGPPRTRELESLLNQPAEFTLTQTPRDLTLASSDGTRKLGFGEDSVVSVYDGIGDQHCGWSAGQFSINIRAVDGRRITHLIGLSKDRTQLLLTTNVSGGGLPSIKFNRVYDRSTAQR